VGSSSQVHYNRPCLVEEDAERHELGLQAPARRHLIPEQHVFRTLEKHPPRPHSASTDCIRHQSESTHKPVTVVLVLRCRHILSNQKETNSSNASQTQMCFPPPSTNIVVERVPFLPSITKQIQQRKQAHLRPIPPSSKLQSWAHFLWSVQGWAPPRQLPHGTA
jgi:hypothetical protein